MNDLIKRSTVLGTLIANYLVGNLTEEALQLYTQEINDIPAVAPEMSAVEYLKARVRMENWSNAMCGETACDACPTCDECPYDPERVPNDTVEVKNPEQAVALVEKWAREHPERSDNQ